MPVTSNAHCPDRSAVMVLSTALPWFRPSSLEYDLLMLKHLSDGSHYVRITE